MSHYTQVELTSPDGKKIEVWWLPVPEGKARVGEKITRRVNDACFGHNEDWVISQVCMTMHEDDLPSKAKKAKDFRFESSTLTYMSI